METFQKLCKLEENEEVFIFRLIVYKSAVWDLGVQNTVFDLFSLHVFDTYCLAAEIKRNLRLTLELTYTRHFNQDFKSF